MTPSNTDGRAPGDEREEIARIIYDALPFDGTLTHARKPTWVSGGNSIRQDDARRTADKILARHPTREAGAAISVHDYVAQYEFRGDGSDHVPTDSERELIEDAIEGYLTTLRSPAPSGEMGREALEHARARFECLAEEFEKAGDETSWAMCSVDADRMTRALAVPQPGAQDAVGEALRTAKACIEDLGSGKGGWAWEEVLQQIDAALQSARGSEGE